ncbi:MAG: hypothetical protein IJG09_06840 [Methanobrevibacter sp.]|nr:hypothetical protein [Methanobrevibacter sp.]MBQ6345468.1 hypothetical protein [Methanobrevibacter sp.]
MKPESLELVVRVIREVNRKVLAETKEEGIKEGMEKGREEIQIKIAKNLKERLNDSEISKVTGLPLDKIQRI